jgi:hypothetical protein
MKVITLDQLRDRIAEFSDRVFGKDRPYTAPLHHLKKEVDEVIDDGAIEEYADCLLLLIDSYRKKFPGIPTSWLLDAANSKINVLETRTWQKPDENGVFEHIRS